VKIGSWGGVDEARKLISEAVERYDAQAKG
jgi:inorganic pyrophosphatase